MHKNMQYISIYIAFAHRFFEQKYHKYALFMEYGKYVKYHKIPALHLEK